MGNIRARRWTSWFRETQLTDRRTSRLHLPGCRSGSGASAPRARCLRLARAGRIPASPEPGRSHPKEVRAMPHTHVTEERRRPAHLYIPPECRSMIRRGAVPSRFFGIKSSGTSPGQ